MDEFQELIILSSVEHENERLFVHEVLEEDFKAEVSREVLFFRLQHVKEVFFELLFLICAH